MSSNESKCEIRSEEDLDKYILNWLETSITSAKLRGEDNCYAILYIPLTFPRLEWEYVHGRVHAQTQKSNDPYCVKQFGNKDVIFYHLSIME